MKRILNSAMTFLVVLVSFFVVVAITQPSRDARAQRIAHLESIVRCPACEDVSVAQSNATSSVAVRHEIARRVREGATDTEILTSLESRYGSSILLSPTTSGWGALLYVIPTIVILGGLVVYRRAARRT